MNNNATQEIDRSAGCRGVRGRVRRFATGSAIVLLAASGYAHAQDHKRLADSPSPPEEPAIIITINPEARISVALSGSLPQPPSCGTPSVLFIEIINHGFLTSRLEAELIGSVPAGTVLNFHPDPLTGAHRELRTLRLTLTSPVPTDLTLAFRSHNNAADLGGRDRIHLLMRCIEAR